MRGRLSYLMCGCTLVAACHRGAAGMGLQAKLSQTRTPQELVDDNRRFYDSLWSGCRLIEPNRFNTWPLVQSVLPASGMIRDANGDANSAVHAQLPPERSSWHWAHSSLMPKNSRDVAAARFSGLNSLIWKKTLGEELRIPDALAHSVLRARRQELPQGRALRPVR